MKLFFFIIVVITGNTVFSQSGLISCKFLNTDSNIIKVPVFVELIRDTQYVFTGYMPFNRSFVFKELLPGFYKFSVHQLGRRVELYDSVQVVNGQTSEFAVTYPGPCKFNYKDGFKPTCPFGHSNNIIPIVYGFPDKHNMKRSKKGKIYLGGCVITDCDPRFYCKLHKVEI